MMVKLLILVNHLGSDYDIVGEWPGFLKCQLKLRHKSLIAFWVLLLVVKMAAHMKRLFVKFLKSSAPGTFRYEDITGTPWVELDYDADLEKAAKKILPQLDA